MSKRPKQRKKSLRERSDWPILMLCALGLVALGFGLYANTLGHAFVFDDFTLIVQSPALLKLDLWSLIGPSGYRPVRNLTYALNYWIGGLEPFGYHLFNVLLHCINGLLLFGFLYALTHRIWLAFPAVLIFLSHPVQTGAVAYVSGRKDLLATFFLIWGLAFYLKSRGSKQNWPWMGLALAAFILACLSKEVALVFPGLLLCLEAVLAAQSGRLSGFWQAIAKRWKLLGSLCGVALLLFLYSVFWLSASRAPGFWGGSISTNYGTTFKLFAHYLKLIVWPSPLVADYLGQVFPLSTGLLEPATLLCVALLLGYVAFTAWCWRKQYLVGLGLTWFGFSILPVLQIIPFHELAADHFLYLPSIGFAIIVGWGIEQLLGRREYRVLGAGALTLLLGADSWATIVRNPVWKTSESLWETTYRDAPGSFRANCNLGSFAHSAGDVAKAVAMTEHCREAKPDDPLPYANLGAMKRDQGMEAIRKGELDRAESLEMEALNYSQKSLKLDPENIWTNSNVGDVYRDLALIYEFRGDLETARTLRYESFATFQKSLAGPTDHPNFPQLYYKTGAIFVDGGDYADAIPFLKKAADALPGYFQAQYVLGFSYYRLADWENGKKYLETALRLRPQPDIIVYLAECYRQLGGPEESLSILQQGSQLYPNSPDIHYNLGVIYQEVGQKELARQHFQQVCQLGPQEQLCVKAREQLRLEQ